uniref:Uncharacterized protein n=1 Tax=Peronospora matthiolae TaxID=2874970 RepID=A0AAV1TM38_9STRA
MKYTSEGMPKNWDGNDCQTYKWAMIPVFKENDLKVIAVGDLTRATLATASAEKQEKEFAKKLLKIMWMIGLSVPPEVLHQIRDKEAGSDMWKELCNLYKGKQNESIRAYTIRRVEHELWNTKLTPGGDVNLHMWKVFSFKAKL